jgi:hypothetical protein
MYVPHTKTRHGDRAVVAEHDGYLKELFNQGGLLLVTQYDRPVAGGVRYIANDTCFSVEHGILEADNELLKHGVNMLLDWYTILWAAEQGARQLNMGGSNPWSSNGIFNYKASWRSHVTGFDYVHEVWQIYADRLSPCLCDFINQVGFITEIKGNFYLIWLEPEGFGQLDEQVGPALDKAIRQGLKGVVVLTPHSRHIFTDQVEPDLQWEDA